MSRKYQLVKFEHRNQDNAKTPGGGNKDKPKFTLTGSELIAKKDTLLNQLEEIYDNWGQDIVDGVPKIIEIKYIKEAKAKSHQTKIIDMFKNYKNTTQIGASSNDGIIVQLSSIYQLDETIKKMKSFDENDVVISAIESVKKYEPIITDETKGEYNITFWDFMDIEQNIKLMNKVEELLGENEIEYKKDSYGGGQSVFEVTQLTLDKLEFIKKLPVKNIEPTEKTGSPFHVLEPTIVDLVPVEYDPNIDYPVIGLLDSGVELNEFTEEWVTRGSGCFYEETELNKSHGTYIASLLIHGDSFNNTSDYSIAGCKIVEVPIVPGYQIDSKPLIRNIETAVKENPEVKIWNLSVSLSGEIHKDIFSDFAKELDRIQEENNILIFKSAGNDSSFYSDRNIGKLSNGADSVRAVTVGSLNRNTDSYGITKEGYPSPYSRTGKGPSYIIKPELVHFGGDLFSLNAKPISEDDYECVDSVGVSINNEIIQKPGTSFSTPKVAKIASEVKNILETDDLLMVKTLLLHSASHSPLVELPEDEITKKMGFGRPSTANEIVSKDNNNSITLMMRGRLEKGKEIDIMDFPFPQTLVENGKFKGRIVVTVAANPHLREDLASEYCQTNLDVKFGTYDKKEDVEGRRAIFNPIKRTDSKNVLLKSLYSKKAMKTNNDYNYERTLIEYGDKYYPVKKYACDLSEFTKANRKYLESDRKWYVYLKGEYRDFITKEKEREREARISGQLEGEFEELGIEYCMVISIYDPEGIENVYDSAITELSNLGFNYQEIGIESEVSIQSDVQNEI